MIPYQSAKSCRPAKAAFAYVATRQQYKVSFRVSMPNHQQVNSMPGGLVCRILARIAPVNKATSTL
jgi:hypothetical protein